MPTSPYGATDPLAVEATHAHREPPSQAVFLGVLAVVMLGVLIIGAAVGIVMAIQPG